MSLQSIRERVRLELQDQATTFQSKIAYSDETNVIKLPVSVVEPAGLVVSQGGVPLTQGVDYTVIPKEGELQLNIVSSVGATFLVSGFHYRLFTNDDLDIFIETALLQHTHNQSPPVVLDDPAPIGSTVLPGVEEYLVAILASVEALWVVATDLTYDIDIMVPEGVSIPRGQRLRQVRELIDARMEEYLSLSRQLNVGLGRLVMSNLRRVSRTTNRLIPIYVPQEFDDRTPPKRIYPKIDQGL